MSHSYIDSIFSFNCKFNSPCLFQIVHDKQRGPLTFLRLYSGEFNTGEVIYNVNQNCTEKSTRLIQVSADEYKEIPLCSAGNIAVVSGLKQVSTHIHTGNNIA